MKTKIMVIHFLMSVALLFWGCDASVNRSIRVGDGERSTGLTSVNGSIRVGSDCRIDGNCRTVNGRIEVGNGSKVRDLDTVNGRIRIGAKVDVDGDARTVNGSIACDAGSKVHGRVGTVNGRIELRNTEVDEEVSTVNGDILLEKSVVRGDIVVKGGRGNFFGRNRLEIRIRDGSLVEGGIIVRDGDIEVKVFLSKDSTVKGEIKNAQLIKE